MPLRGRDVPGARVHPLGTEEKTVGASCHRHPGLDDFAAFVRYSKASRLGEEPRGPRPSRSRKGGGFPPSGPRGPQAVPAARPCGRTAGETFSQSGSSIDASSYVPGCNFAPTAGFRGPRPLSPSRRTAPWPGERLDFSYVPHMFRLVKPPASRAPNRFRAGPDHGMPWRCGRGGTGRRRRLKISCPSGRAGSSPAVRTRRIRIAPPTVDRRRAPIRVHFLARCRCLDR